MRPALVIAAKDLRQRLRDRSALLIAVVVPLVLASIFGLIFHNAIGGRVSFTFGLLDQDHGAVAQGFTSGLLWPLERRGLVRLEREPTLASARSDTDHRRVSATFVLPRGLSAAVVAGRPATITLLGNSDAAIGTQVAQSLARSYADRLDTISIAVVGARGTAVDRERIAHAAPPISIADISTQSRQLDAGTFYAAGMAVFFLFFTVPFGISSILDERREGTLARILVAPIRRSAVLAGKLLTSFVLGCVSMAVLALATHFLLSAHWGNALAVALLIVSGVIAATAVMALVTTLARTPDQAQAWQQMVALVLGMLGGTFFPVARAGGVLAALSLATPQAWFLRGIQNLAGGAGPGAVAGPVLAMLAFAAVTGAVAFMRSGRLVGR